MAVSHSREESRRGVAAGRWNYLEAMIAVAVVINVAEQLDVHLVAGPGPCSSLQTRLQRGPAGW